MANTGTVMSIKSCPISKIVELLSWYMILLMGKVIFCNKSNKQGLVRSILYNNRYEINPIESKKTGKTLRTYEEVCKDCLNYIFFTFIGLLVILLFR